MSAVFLPSLDGVELFWQRMVCNWGGVFEGEGWLVLNYGKGWWRGEGRGEEGRRGEGEEGEDGGRRGEGVGWGGGSMERVGCWGGYVVVLAGGGFGNGSELRPIVLYWLWWLRWLRWGWEGRDEGMRRCLGEDEGYGG